MTTDTTPLLTPTLARPALRSPIPAAAGLALCLLLAIAQVAWAGYELGVGNQAIQIAFLKHWADPTLFANDDMVRQTLPLYPSYFFRLLAPLLHVMPLASLYFSLHVLTTFFTLATTYLLGRAIFRSHASALAAVAILLAGHHRALAGDTLYSTGFTHTYVALPFAIAALTLAYRRRMFWAFAVAGLLFDLHALTGAYTLLMLCAALIAVRHAQPLTKWFLQLCVCAIIAATLAAPALLQMFSQHQAFDNAWIDLMRVRSAEHSFPATWWVAGNPDLPRFALLLALFALSWSFGPVRQPDSIRTLKLTRWMTAAILTLFAAGYLFTEIIPTPLIIRLQPFRASRILLVLMFVHIAHAAVVAIRAGWTGTTLSPDGAALVISKPVRLLEALAGALVLATLALPPLLPLLPITLITVTLVALISGRLSWFQSIISAAALLIALLANRQIQFPLPFISTDITALPSTSGSSITAFALAAILTASVLATLIAVARRRAMRHLFLAATWIAASVFTVLLFQQQYNGPPHCPLADLASIAKWAKSSTPKDALFLTPTGLSNFRILSDRALVGDWRDGTQLYFSNTFAHDWFERLSDLEPGIALSPDNTRLLSRGKSLDSLDNDTLLALAKKYHATYLLLPTPESAQQRPLQIAYTDAHFTAYTLDAPVAAPTLNPIPPGVLHPNEWTAMQKFMHTTVADNIDRYRKGDLTVQIVDPDGRPIQDLPAVLNQTRHAFNFGVSLGFFEPNNINPPFDEKGAPVTPEELAYMPTVFNASMIPFSSKWVYTEPAPGELHYSDLDKYIGFCADHHITVEYHFLAGYAPMWLQRNQAEQLKRYPDHSMGLIDRFHDRVQFWQLTNEGHLMGGVPALYKLVRATYPDLKLGIADCVKFYSTDENPIGKTMDMYRGLQAVPWLQKQGVKLDYFGIHGHRPYGLWADPRTMYEVFDTVAKLGVKIHVTEMLLPLGTPIIGPVRKGTWTPELQADFMQDYLAVCFSHPSVELVNFWGLVRNGWGDSAGLLDDHLKPRPDMLRIAHLINEVWHTRLAAPLPLEGKLATRAFFGDYELSLTLPDGKTITASFAFPDAKKTAFRFTLDEEAGTLTRN